uniref:Uncharacterized protein n=1 Tax=Helianthus annuus TaxID=4232 RepID=A0A251U7V8_HELAN
MYHFLDRENLPWNNPTLLRISPKRVLPAPNRLDQIAMTSKFYHKILILMEHSDSRANSLVDYLKDKL